MRHNSKISKAHKVLNKWTAHCWTSRTGFKSTLAQSFSTQSNSDSRFQLELFGLGRRGRLGAHTACRLDDGDSPCGVTTFKNDLRRLGDAQHSQQTAVHGCGVKQPTDGPRPHISHTFSLKVTDFWVYAAFACHGECRCFRNLHRRSPSLKQTDWLR